MRRRTQQETGGDAAHPHLHELLVRDSCRRLKFLQRRPELRWADLTESQADALTATLAASDTPAPDATHAHELAVKLLDLLGPEDRLVVTMLDLEGWSVAEVRKATGWREGAIRIRAFRARRKLRKEILKLEKQR
jgi:RNA polymerase sigma-70 factor (ECF subfamily)